MRALAFLLSLAAASGPASLRGDDLTPAGLRSTVERGIAFLVKDAQAWKSEHQCTSCHHASLVVWSLLEAKQRGFSVDEPFLAEWARWIAEAGDGKTGVPRPEGIPKALNTKAVYFALALGASAQLDDKSREGIKGFLKTIEGDQVENGSWAAWPETRPPFFGGSDDSMTALATLALVSAGSAGDEAAKAARDRGLEWIARTKTDGDPQSVALRLVVLVRAGHSAEEQAPLVREIRDRQGPDGGWSQAKDLQADAWATGQALYALSCAAAPPQDPAIERGRAFLARTQREDGSWPMTSRPTKPGGEGSKNLIPIVGGGSAWAVLGLARSR